MKFTKSKEVISWCLFDFANSSYSAVISAVVFPIYYVSVVVGNESGKGDLWWGWAISGSMIVVAITSPFLGGISDFSGKRKQLLLSYTLLCIVSVACFSFLTKGMVFEGFLLIVLANIGMEGGLVFYNSFLPEIANKEYHGRVSAWGYAVGYAGSVTALLAAFKILENNHYHAVWLMVALFFFLSSLPAFIFLPADRKSGYSVVESARKGIGSTLKTIKTVAKDSQLRKFLVAFLLYEDGVNTVIVFSSVYASTTLGFQQQELIGLYLIVQVTALSGAFIMAKPIDQLGPKKIVCISLSLWSAVTVGAFFITVKTQFWYIACFAGLGLGTVQAASRAFFTQFIPSGHETEYFGVYALVGKSSAIIGPLLFGIVSSSFGSQRPAILAVSVFFISGLMLILQVRGGGPNIKQQALPNNRDA